MGHKSPRLLALCMWGLGVGVGWGGGGGGACGTAPLSSRVAVEVAQGIRSVRPKPCSQSLWLRIHGLGGSAAPPTPAGLYGGGGAVPTCMSQWGNAMNCGDGGCLGAGPVPAQSSPVDGPGAVHRIGLQHQTGSPRCATRSPVTLVLPTVCSAAVPFTGWKSAEERRVGGGNGCEGGTAMTFALVGIRGRGKRDAALKGKGRSPVGYRRSKEPPCGYLDSTSGNLW